MAIEDKLNELMEAMSGADETDKEQLRDWGRMIQVAEVFKDLGDHEGVKMLAEEYKDEVERIEATLMDEKYMNTEGKMLLAKRDWYRRFLDSVTGHDEMLKNLENDLDEQLKYAKSEGFIE